MIILKGMDIGEVGKKGSLITKENNYTLSAGGSDIWGTMDEGFFSYLDQDGDFDFCVRIHNSI